MTASDTPFKSLIKGKNEPNVVPTTPETLSKNIVERFSLRGKVSVITGGAGAIGSAIAEGFAQAGSDVIILDLKPNSSISQGLSLSIRSEANLSKSISPKARMLRR